MRLWLFTFTQVDRAFVSLRVAAPTRDEAVTYAASFLDRPLISAAFERPEEGTILNCIGRLDTDQPGLVSVIKADGTWVEAK